MPTDIHDVTNRYAPDVQRPSPLVVCELKRAFAGTFCFPFGHGFGCGASLEIEQGREYSLEAKLGAGGEEQGLSGEVTFGTTYTFNMKWSYTSDKCEYCRPQICFPSSKLFVYECERFLGFWSWTDVKQIFVPGPQGEIENNCTPNDPKCGCRDEKSAVLQTGGRVSYRGGAAAACVLSTVHFARRQSPNEPSDGKAAAASALELLENSLPHSLGWEAERQALGVIGTGAAGIHWLHGGGSDVPRRVSLLSTGCADGRVASPRRLSGRFLPVLAATDCLPGARAEVSLVLTSPSGKRRQLAEDVEVRTGVCTVLWAEFDLGARRLEPGTSARLHLRVADADGCRLGELVETFRAPLEPEG